LKPAPFNLSSGFPLIFYGKAQSLNIKTERVIHIGYHKKWNGLLNIQVVHTIVIYD
jgi:hypothetical protein